LKVPLHPEWLNGLHTKLLQRSTSGFAGGELPAKFFAAQLDFATISSNEEQLFSQSMGGNKPRIPIVFCATGAIATIPATHI